MENPIPMEKNMREPMKAGEKPSGIPPPSLEKNRTGEKTPPASAEMSAFLMLLSGIALTAASFILPPIGEISDSAMKFMGEALIYAGSVFGLTVYVDHKINKTLNR